MAKQDENIKKSGGGGGVLLVVVVLIVIAFVGDDHPMDRLADMIMIGAWVLAIFLLVFVVFFTLVYCMQTAMADLYESLVEDFEESPIKSKIMEYKAIIDEKLLGRGPQTPSADVDAEDDIPENKQ